MLIEVDCGAVVFVHHESNIIIYCNCVLNNKSFNEIKSALQRFNLKIENSKFYIPAKFDKYTDLDLVSNLGVYYKYSNNSVKYAGNTYSIKEN